MGVYRFEVRTAASPERAFDLWTNLERMKEWVGGLVAAIFGRIFAGGSYRGSFQGELNAFAELAAREG